MGSNLLYIPSLAIKGLKLYIWGGALVDTNHFSSVQDLGSDNERAKSQNPSQPWLRQCHNTGTPERTPPWWPRLKQSNVLMCCIAMCGLPSAVKIKVKTCITVSILQKCEINPPKMACGCLCTGVRKQLNGHTSHGMRLSIYSCMYQVTTTVSSRGMLQQQTEETQQQKTTATTTTATITINRSNNNNNNKEKQRQQQQQQQ